MTPSSDLLKLSDVPGLLADIRYPESPGEQDLLMPDVMRLDAEMRFKSFLQKCIAEGQLLQRSHAGEPIPSELPVWHGGYVLRTELQRTLDIYGIQIQLDGPSEIVSISSNDETLQIKYAEQQEAKRQAGRYTLEEATKILGHEAGERQDAVLRSLVKAATAGELPMYGPGENLRRDYKDEHTKTVRDFYEEAHWNDLNKWLENYAPRISYRFPKPSGADIRADLASPHAKLELRPPKPKRRDILWPAIEKAIVNAGREDVAAVWLALRELALDEEPPFDGTIGDDWLQYTKGMDKKQFSRDSLRKRLGRLKETVR